MAVPILFLIASIQSALTDGDVPQRHDVLAQVKRHH
jgi:hypothetical protein